MKYLLILLITSFLYLEAKNPELYAAIGDPLYNTLPYTQKLSKLYAFSNQKEAFTYYISEVKKAKVTGLRLDQFSKSRDIQDYQKYYIKTLRKLESLDIDIRATIKRITLETIKSDNTTRFYAIIDTHHPFLTKDTTLIKAIKTYKNALKKREAIKVAAQKEQRAQEKAKQENFFRSFANLQYLWEGTQANEKVRLEFKSSSFFTLTKVDNKHQQILHGHYKLEKDVLTLITDSITNINQRGTKHTRERTVEINYQILKINATILTLQPLHRKKMTLKKVHTSSH